MEVVKKYFSMIPVKFRHYAFGAIAFASALSFISVNSAWADKHHINGLMWVSGIVFGALVIALFKIANDENKA